MSSGTYPAIRTKLQKRGNPNWGKPCQSIPDRSTLFEELVKKHKLEGRPELWQDSRALKMFAERNHGSRYVPEWLLKIWGFEIDDGDVNISFRGLSA